MKRGAFALALALALQGTGGAALDHRPKAAPDPVPSASPQADPGAPPGAAKPAAGGFLSTDGRGPISIDAEQGIEWIQTKKAYVARGDAVAKRGDVTLRADTLTAFYREIPKANAGKPAAAQPGAAPPSSTQAGAAAHAGVDPANGAQTPGGPTGKPASAAKPHPAEPSDPVSDPGAQPTEIYRMTADGGVRVWTPTESVVGDHGVYDADQALVVMTGKALKLTTPQDQVTARDSLEWYDDKQLAVARGNALAVRGDRRMRADVLAAHVVRGAEEARQHPSERKLAAASAETDKGGSRISRIDATGHVVVVSRTSEGESQIGSGDRGVYDVDTGRATLSGHVVLTRGDSTMVGDYGMVDMKSGVSRLLPRASTAPGASHGRVQGYIVPPQKDRSEDPKPQ